MIQNLLEYRVNRTKPPAWLSSKRAIGVIGLAVLVAAAYLPCVHGAFIWDDDRYPGWPLLSAAGAWWRIWVPGYTIQYYPATFASFWIERRLWGLEPTGFHIVNMALHVFNAALAGACLRRLGFRGAWLAAALFAVHPVHAESVAWLSERKNLLSAFFYLSAFAAFLESEDLPGLRWYALGFLLFVLALLSKTTSCTLPAALLVVRWGRGRTLDEPWLKRLIPLFAAGAFIAALTAAMERANAGAVGPEFSLSFAQKLILAAREPFFYAAKLLWPARLSFAYEHWTLDASDPGQWLWVAAAAAAVTAAWTLRERLGRAAPAAIGFFLVTLSPALGFFPVYTFRFSYVADHYQYLASLGLIALAAEALWRGSRARWAAAAVVLGFLPLTRARAALYAVPGAVWRDAVDKSPRSALARHNWGVFLQEAGRLDEAIAQYQEAIRIKGDFEDAYNSLGAALIAKGDPEGAARNFRRALEIEPNHVMAHRNLGSLLFSRRRFSEAAAHYLAVVKMRPGDAGAHNNLGTALGFLGRTEEAIVCFRQALLLHPGHESAAKNLRLALAARP
jgi:tetratricopeptide (TPR) repeat protein